VRWLQARALREGKIAATDIDLMMMTDDPAQAVKVVLEGYAAQTRQARERAQQGARSGDAAPPGDRRPAAAPAASRAETSLTQDGAPRVVDLALLAAEAMRERGLAPEFPPEAMRQAEALSDPARSAGRGVRDMTVAGLVLDRQRRHAGLRPAHAQRGPRARRGRGCWWRWPTSMPPSPATRPWTRTPG
jgi:hypothetical protein